VGVGLPAWINVIVPLLLCPQAVRDLREYESSLKKNS
jgi:AGCS family alanine or glycine:cation symporter